MAGLCSSPLNRVMAEAVPAQHTQQVLLTLQLHLVLGKMWCPGRTENWKTNAPSHVEDKGGGREEENLSFVRWHQCQLEFYPLKK